MITLLTPAVHSFYPLRHRVVPRAAVIDKYRLLGYGERGERWMSTGTKRLISASTVIAVFAALTYLSAVMLPWRLNWADFGFWISLFILCFVELVPIHVGDRQFHFRLLVQLPWIFIYGLFPLMLAECAIQLGIAAVRIFRMRVVELRYPRMAAATVPAMFVAMLHHLLFHKLGISISARGMCYVVALIAGFWCISLVVKYMPGPRGMLHPWRPGRTWKYVWLACDAVLAWLAVIESILSASRGAWLLNIEFVAIIGIVALYTDSTIRRTRMLELSNLITDLAKVNRIDEVVQQLFDGLERLIAADVATVWIVGPDMALRPAYVHIYHARGTELAEKYKTDPPSVPFGFGLVGFAASSREVVAVNSPGQRVMFERAAERLQQPSAIAAPILVNDEVYGVLCLHSCTSLDVYRERERELLGIVRQHLGALLATLWRFEQTRIQSEVDDLTGLYNYRFFDNALHHMVAVSDAQTGPLCLLIVDIDHFKQVNDRYGHVAGNQVLRKLAGMLREVVRDGDIVARYGGEEFTILLPGLSSDEGLAVAERIRRQVEQTEFEVEDGLRSVVANGGFDPVASAPRRNYIRLTLSIGVATYPETSESALTLLRHADRAMYVGSKQRGRNRVSAYGK